MKEKKTEQEYREERERGEEMENRFFFTHGDVFVGRKVFGVNSSSLETVVLIFLKHFLSE